MEAPNDLKYTKEHEWINIADGIATIGITDYAQEQLGDVVFVELPKAGEEFKAGDTFGAVESVKSVSDCFVPIDGKVVEVNDLLQESPETVNQDCYGEGWMLKLKIGGELPDDVMSAAEYEQFVSEESE